MNRLRARLFGLYLVTAIGGCGGAVSVDPAGNANPRGDPPPETQLERAYRLCGDLGMSETDIYDIFQASEIDFNNGLGYDDEVHGVAVGCGNGCDGLEDLRDYCAISCYNCGVAIVNLVYFPER